MNSIKKGFIVIALMILLFLIFKSSFYRFYFDSKEHWILRDKIIWTENTKLNWSNFKNVENDGDLYPKVGLSSRFNVNDPILFRSHTVFIPKESYVSDTTENLNLRIAQFKFDLLETYRRKMVKKVDSLRKIGYSDLKPSDFETMTESYYKLFDKEWERYISLKMDLDTFKRAEEKIRIELRK